VVGLAEEAALTPVSALRHMMRNARRHHPRQLQRVGDPKPRAVV